MKSSNVAKVIVGILLLVILYLKVDFAKVMLELGKINPLIIFVVACLYFITFLLGALNIKVLLSHLTSVPFIRALNYFSMSWAVGLYSPGKIGTAVNMYFFKKEGLSFGEASSLFFVDKIISLLVIATIGVFGAYAFFTKSLALIFIIFIMLILLSIICIRSSKLRSFIAKVVLRSFAKILRGFYKNIVTLTNKHKGIIVANICLTVAQWFLSFLATYILFISLNVSISFFQVAGIVCIVKIITLIPISLSGLGIREVSAVYLFSLIAIPVSSTAAVYTVGLVLFYGAGLLILMAQKKEYRDVISIWKKYLKRKNTT